ncbi:protein-tyrosine phosphatase family protein [Hyalangium rubrum]|uniref:Dual specificity protein phosphatase n=1 Tax=Hyalangium rubrum TaxID=3103134 RepID=A0ABU5GY59_9BACT|nr:dual specificity protein phosphatase [Hyalangium sp. s54d21]MDY7226130.1 dual specificity protein phosphatase [Hyalangium sp. s54d21]
MKEPGWKLNLNWITPQLAVGGRFPVEAVEHMALQLGIRHVVDVRVEARDDEHVLREHGITFLHLPTVDLRAINEEMLEDGVRWVSEHLELGHKVYIHCEHGVGRSATLALCVLVAQGDSPLEALERAKTARWQVAPSPEQLEAFMQWSEGWRARHGVPWKVPAFKALSEIAYRHLRKPPKVEEE